jgi:hypothetical protein
VSGSSVFYTLAGTPEHIAIPVAVRSVYEERMHSRVVLPSDIEHLP